MDDKTIKEISDVITAEVMKQVQANLSEMKPKIIEEITNNVLNVINANNNQRTVAASSNSTSNNKQQRWGTPNFSDEQLNKILNSCKEIADDKHISRAYMGRTLEKESFVINGDWIYYIQSFSEFGGYGYLYKVKTNGTYHSRIIEESVRPFPKDKYDEFYIENNLLHYVDTRGEPHAIDISTITGNNNIKKNIDKIDIDTPNPKTNPNRNPKKKSNFFKKMFGGKK
ncbi:hypothetical protein [Ruminococcus sp.]|uniref:hypothetical protein n=1 Tax=Ruminococcus sp. TaxID=41978 RepID=UPI0025F0146D|nr:hypothetical protein [Ruminococcus sp.]MBR1432095.1 hypothetical protein [Ruminococcus sp.]